MMPDNNEFEALCAEVHKVYCQYHLSICAKEFWTKGDYSLLKEPDKEADRHMARFVQEKIEYLQSQNKVLLKALEYYSGAWDSRRWDFAETGQLIENPQYITVEGRLKMTSSDPFGHKARQALAAVPAGQVQRAAEQAVIEAAKEYINRPVDIEDESPCGCGDINKLWDAVEALKQAEGGAQ